MTDDCYKLPVSICQRRPEIFEEIFSGTEGRVEDDDCILVSLKSAIT